MPARIGLDRVDHRVDARRSRDMRAAEPSVSSGSRIAQSGRRRGETTPFFSVVGVVTMAIGVTSEPVPAVVGTSRAAGAGLLPCQHRRCRRGDRPSWRGRRRALPYRARCRRRSKEPASIRFSRHRATARLDDMRRRVGDHVLEHRSRSDCLCETSSASCVRPALRTPLSVTRSTRCAPNSATRSCDLLDRPGSKRMLGVR